MVEKVQMPEWENVFWALCESMEQDGKEVKIDEHLSVGHKRWCHATLCYTDEYNVELFSDNGALCCEDEEEFAGECAAGLLEKLEEWYERQVNPVDNIFDANCWEQAEPFYDAVWERRERSVLQNCIWGIEGCEYNFDTLIKNGWNYGLPIERTKELWQIAYWWVAEGCMVAA